MTQDVKVLRIERHDDVIRLILNRPEVGNALDLPLAEALLDAAILCQTDETIRCVVLTGAGRLFCVGGDIDGFIRAGENVPAYLNRLAGVLHMALARFARMPKPLVVLVNGPAAGAGVGLALCGDIVLASRSAHMSAAYGKLGLTPDGGLSWLLPRLIGIRRSQEFILTNRRITADEAESIGMVTRAVDADALEAEGQKAVQALRDCSTHAVAATRALLRDSWLSGFETQMEREAEAIATSGATVESRTRVSRLMRPG
jgi:2-(1,2-epoxy-1,2-dihydrophenyl)acetyl-CoA isomerase